jgi:hypothetical protein
MCHATATNVLEPKSELWKMQQLSFLSCVAEYVSVLRYGDVSLDKYLHLQGQAV